MKRKIEITTPSGIKVTATINTRDLARYEVEKARDSLATALMHAVAGTSFLSCELSRVKVK